MVGFDDVAKGDFVLAIEYGGKLYVEVPETVTGELQSFSTSKATLKLDETTYDISDIVASVNGADKETFAIYDYLAEDNILGASATYYLDNNGYIVAVCEADETYGNYAVILSKQAYEAGSGTSLGKDARVKVLLADGTIDTLDVYSIDGKKPGETGYSAKESAVAQYDIYSYALTEDGDLKLGTERGSVDTTTTMSYTKGSSTLTAGSKYAVTNSTVFLYYDGSDVVRFVGKTSPDISYDSASVATTVAVSSNNPKEAAVVFVNDTATAQYDGNYLYVYKEKVAKNSDGYEADVILADGTITTITIDSESFDSFKIVGGGMKINAGMYAYSVTDDVYSLSNSGTPATFIKSGVILASRSDYITLDESYTLIDDTIVAYGETNKTASVGEALNTGDSVVIVINEDDEVEFAVITRYAADNIVDGSKDDIEDALEAAGEDGVVEISGELPSEGITVPADRTLVLTGNVEGTATIGGDGTVELNDSTVIDGNVTLTGKVDVTDTVKVNGTLDLTAADVVDVETLVLDVAAGATVVNAAWDSSDFTESAFVVAGNAAGGIVVTFGDAVLTGDLSINTKDTLVVEGTLEVGEHELRVTGNITVKGTLDLTGSNKVIAPEAITFAKGATLIVDAAWTELDEVISDAGTYTYNGEVWTAAE